MAKIDLNEAIVLLEKWDDENPDDLEWYMKAYGESLLKWLYSNNYIVVKKERRED